MPWVFENTGYNTGSFNMQYDEQLAREVAAGLRPPTVRVYGWSPSAVSYGWNQSPEEINLNAAQQAGIDVVRRPTGGRAILHSDELTYSVVLAELPGLRETRSISTVYREISEALVFGLRYIGVNASLEKSQPDFPSLYRSTSGIACFSSSARYEIKVGGRKLVGSAQRRYRFDGKEVILQHGSLLLGPDHLRIADFIALGSNTEREALRSELSMKTTDVKSILGQTIDPDEVVAALRRGFEDRWGVLFESGLAQTVHEL